MLKMSKVDIEAREQIRTRVNRMQHMVTEAKQYLDKGDLTRCCDRMQASAEFGVFDACYLSLIKAVDVTVDDKPLIPVAAEK